MRDKGCGNEMRCLQGRVNACRWKRRTCAAAAREPKQHQSRAASGQQAMGFPVAASPHSARQIPLQTSGPPTRWHRFGVHRPRLAVECRCRSRDRHSLLPDSLPDNKHSNGLMRYKEELAYRACRNAKSRRQTITKVDANDTTCSSMP